MGSASSASAGAAKARVRKLNATAEMLPVSFPGFSKLHPFAPREQAQGYSELFRQLEDDAFDRCLLAFLHSRLAFCQHEDSLA